jgi:hypothetical protein
MDINTFKAIIDE